jgi:hypothetical protein
VICCTCAPANPCLLCLSGALDTLPPCDVLEQLSSYVEGFPSPHVLLYAKAALQAMEGRHPGTNTLALIAYGVLPHAGRPEHIQV